MAKRKRELADGAGSVLPVGKSRKEDSGPTKRNPVKVKQQQQQQSKLKASTKATTNGNLDDRSHLATQSTVQEISQSTTVQIITGSYERVLHGFTASITPSQVTGSESAQSTPNGEAGPVVDFSDTFLFNAHASAIRCLALSPPSELTSAKVLLATGSTDERINIYTLSNSPPIKSSSKPKLPTLSGTTIAENSRNREQGSLLHHSSSITALYFPSRGKLLSSAEDSTIAITRTRDWEPLSSIKAPIPKPQGRPSGDTAAPGEVPAGINDFAVHPSMKLMVSVGKGEKCMRLWNLVTGKKAGVLNFGREILSAVGEGRFGAGEGRRVIWDPEGEEFTVAFERGAVVFGIDSKPRATVVPTPRSKVHQIHYVPGSNSTILAVSTEDGRVIFYDTSITSESTTQANSAKDVAATPAASFIAQLGGPASGATSRVKDFEILPLNTSSPSTVDKFLIITGSSDGTTRVWDLSLSDLQTSKETDDPTTQKKGFTAKQVGNLLGTYSTGTRITCLKAFIMTGEPEAEAEDEDDKSASQSSSEDGDEEADEEEA